MGSYPATPLLRPHPVSPPQTEARGVLQEVFLERGRGLRAGSVPAVRAGALTMASCVRHIPP